MVTFPPALNLSEARVERKVFDLCNGSCRSAMNCTNQTVWLPYPLLQNRSFCHDFLVDGTINLFLKCVPLFIFWVSSLLQ